ncbi:MAG: hypothetical protein JWN15_3990 [Firmicutes bacterium]|nr:hypothetical protein [Bacillota bacterium]
MKLIRAAQAARLLGVDPATLRRRAAGRDYLEIYGHRLRVFRMDIGPGAEGRFEEDEVRRLVAKLDKAQ